MADLHEAELRIAVAEGLITRADANALAEEARQKQQSPLTLLVERGQLSEDSYRSLLGNVATGTDLDGSTVTGPTMPAARAPTQPAFPVAAWDRYTNIAFLGQGGMGQVFLAQDLRLRREVAIKFVRGDDPEYVRRLIAEARAQARVSHERVCKVHEVGEVDGKVYIAMQYIDGHSLDRIAGELTVEQKVMLIRGAAEGLHEAHRAGIIHRDIKPSNIMVARSEEGELKPYVMDFGLARAAADDGQTLSGAVLGTPRYMSPEQARGHVGTLDRRADIYSLGATLYHLLTGRPPTPGATVMEVLHNLSTSEPRPPRALDPDIPVDLEAIVLKCLEKDRSARYDSARALADDLGRFLNGEPVIARAAGAWYRLRKRLAKHRRLVAASAVALAVSLVAVGWGLKTRHEANERERLARRFTEQVEGIEAMARYSAQSPEHDIRGDQAAIRAKMAALEGDIGEAGAIAAGPGYYALGRGYLALGDDARAREQLELAWQLGFREPRVAYALALAMGHLYQQNLLAAERIEQKDVRETKRQEIEKQYRAPALRYLEASTGAEVPSPPEYVAALVAFYEGHLDAALHHLDAIGGGLPWFYEGPELRGDILLARGLNLRDQGEDERARSDFEAGRRAYAAAADIGRSVPAVYASLAELEYAALVMELYGAGDVLPPFNRAVAATTHTLALMPEHYEALVLEARAHRSLAEYQADHGSNVEDLLKKAIADAQHAVTLSPARPQARLETARIYRQWGEARQSKSEDPREQLRQAVEASEGIGPEGRDAPYYGNLGLIYTVGADYEDQVGMDAQASRGKAIDAYSKALQINDKLNQVWINLGINYFGRASQLRGHDPDDDLTRALRALDKARSINPKHYVPFYYEGMIYELMAQRATNRGLDPDADLTRSLDMYKAGLAINPEIPQLHNGIGSVLMGQAKAAWDRGTMPEPLLDQAQTAFEQAIAAAPDQGWGYNNVGSVLAQRAWFQRARGEDPSANVRAAVDALSRAFERTSDPSFWTNLGMAHSLLATYDLEHERDPQPSLAQASSAIRNALEKNPKDARSQFYLGETRGTLARFRAQQGHGSAEDFEQSAQAFQQAIDLEPENQDYQIAFGHFCRAWAMFQRDTGIDAGPSLKRGIDLANHVLAIRPAWSDARTLRASLLLLQAQLSASAAERHERSAKAAEDFTQALAINPALDKAWSSQAALAQRLASAVQ